MLPKIIVTNAKNVVFCTFMRVLRIKFYVVWTVGSFIVRFYQFCGSFAEKKKRTTAKNYDDAA